MNITIIEDHPSYVKNALDQLGSSHKLQIIPTIHEAIKYFRGITKDEIAKPEMILIVCMLPVTPNEKRLAVIHDMDNLYEAFSKTVIAGPNEVRAQIKRDKERAEIEKGRSPEINSEINSMRSELSTLRRDLHVENPVGYNFVLEAIMLSIKYIGLLKGAAHALPPIGVCGADLFYDGDVNYSPVYKEKNQKFKNMQSSIIIGETGYQEFGQGIPIKRWDWLLEDLIKL